MRRNYMLFEWLSKSDKRKEFVSSKVFDQLLLMRTNNYDLSVHRMEGASIGRKGIFGEIIGEERIWLRDRESGEKRGIVKGYYLGDGLIEKLIKSQNRNRDLWKLELSIKLEECAGC